MPTPSIIKLDPTVETEPWEPFPEAEILSGTRAQAGRTAFIDIESRLTVGVWEQEKNETTWMDYPTNEFMVMIEGHVVIVEEGRTTEVGPGEVFFLPKGLRCRWTQTGKVRKFFFIHEDTSNSDDPNSLTPIVIGSELSGHEEHDRRLPHEDKQGSTLFTNSTGDLTISTQNMKGSNSLTSSVHEFIYLIEGQLDVEDGAMTYRFQGGDSFFVPQGTSFKWRAQSPVRTVSARLI